MSWGLKCGLFGCETVTSQRWQTSCVNLLCTLLDADVLAYPNIVWGALCAGADSLEIQQQIELRLSLTTSRRNFLEL